MVRLYLNGVIDIRQYPDDFDNLIKNFDNDEFCKKNFIGFDISDGPVFDVIFKSGNEEKRFCFSNRPAANGELRSSILRQCFEEFNFSNLRDFFAAALMFESQSHSAGEFATFMAADKLPKRFLPADVRALIKDLSNREIFLRQNPLSIGSGFFDYIQNMARNHDSNLNEAILSIDKGLANIPQARHQFLSLVRKHLPQT
jgi:hypothetical protein